MRRDKDAMSKANDRWKEDQKRASHAKEEEVMSALREAQDARCGALDLSIWASIIYILYCTVLVVDPTLNPSGAVHDLSLTYA